MLPTSWRRIPITGRFVGRDGVPIVGRLLFDSAQVVEIDANLIVPRRIFVALNTNGEIPADTSLPSTNDPDLSVTGWAYTVTEDWVGGRKPYRMFVPYDAVSISIPEAAHAVPPPELIDNRGPRGYSAYEIAVQEGFDGTVQEWLESLRGSPGQDGEDGADGIQGPPGPGGGSTMVLQPNNVSTPEDVEASGNLLANDTTTVGVLRVFEYWIAGIVGAFSAGVTTPILGVGEVTIHADGEYSFQPGLNYNGAVPLINYSVTNGSEFRVSSLVLTIQEVDDSPVAGANAAMTAVNEPVTFGILGNDFDPEGSGITLTHINGTTATVGAAISVPNGSVVRNIDNTITFTPAADFEGNSVFTYTISSGSLSSNGTINVQVGFENIPLFSPVSPILEGDYFDEANTNFGKTMMGRVGNAWDNGVNVSDATYSAGQGNFDLGQREPWLYDRATTTYILYLRTKDETILAKALEYAELYMTGVVMTYDLADFTTGGGVAGDPKYLYPIIAWWYERETGDPVYRPQAAGLYRQALASFPIAYSAGAALWTERNMNYAIQACLAQYWITGDPAARANAEAYFGTLVTMSTTTGAPLHPHSQHEGTSISTPITSPWMGAMLVDTLLQLYRTNGDEDIVAWIARYCDFIVTNGFYVNSEAPAFLGLRVPAYLAGVGITYPDAGGPYGDAEHAYDVAIMLQKGMWAKGLLEQDTSAMQTIITELLTVAVATFENWTRTTVGLPRYRLNPPRKGPWWFRHAYSKNYFAGVVPLAPISLTLPTISGNTPAGSVLTVTPGTWAGDPVPVITRQWLRSGADISGATATTYTTVEADVGETITIEETATNTGGAVTRLSAVGIVVTAAGSPVITSQPVSQTVNDGADVSFAITFTGAPTPALQWQESTDGGATFGDMSGRTTSPLALTAVEASMSGRKYRARLTNPGDTVYSNVVTLYVAVALDAIAFTPSQGAVLTQALLPPGGANFTMEALVRIDAPRIGNRRIITNRYIADRTASVGAGNNFPDYDPAVGDSQTGWTGGVIPETLTQGEWFFITLSADSNVDGGLFRGTIQDLIGGAIASQTRAKGFTGLLNHVGFEVNGGGIANEGMAISVQYVRAFNSQRTTEQLQADRTGVNASECLFWWVFEDNGSGGVTVRDASGNSRVPTLVGGTLTTGPVAPLV